MKISGIIATVIALVMGHLSIYAQTENTTKTKNSSSVVATIKSAVVAAGEDKEKILDLVAKAARANPDQVTSIVVAAIEAVIQNQLFGGDASFIALIVEVAVKEVPQAVTAIAEAAVAKATDAATVSAIVEGAVKAAPDSAPAITSAAVMAVTNPALIPSVVEAAIEAAPQSVASIVEAAITAAPDSSAAITQTATATAPDAAAVIQNAASNAQASVTPNPLNFPGQTPLGEVLIGEDDKKEDKQDGASGDQGFGGGGYGDGGFTDGGGGGSVIVFPPILPPTTRTNPK